MKKALLILTVLLFSACAEIEVKLIEIDPYAGDPVSEDSKERGILIDTTKK